MRAASQLPGKGPTDVDDAPAPALAWPWLVNVQTTGGALENHKSGYKFT